MSEEKEIPEWAKKAADRLDASLLHRKWYPDHWKSCPEVNHAAAIIADEFRSTPDSRAYEQGRKDGIEATATAFCPGHRIVVRVRAKENGPCLLCERNKRIQELGGKEIV